ncbi:DUF2752 domain-containing protein [Butyrivibrio sp. AE3004]|uniref:DUF2752 domain-containing protein n=1 Tax=Butyrivibrio sp. AE3004 TaxID=1506994 RepID=UPI00068E16EE|nr:DUF2752 domain-containing protein [Butyrivibrio sp. AE3004]
MKNNNNTLKNKNISSAFKEAAIIAAILMLNAIVYIVTGYGIPCVFKLITGLSCPGCGMTHAYLELLHGNIEGAISYNILSVTVMPLLILFLIYKAVVLIRTGSTKMKTWENMFLICIGIVTGIFFIYRNIPGIISHPLFGLIISK